MAARRQYDAAKTRRSVLDAASDAFQRNGYHATSMNDVMTAADVPAGSVYHQFASKKALAHAVIEERVVPGLRKTWIEPLENGEDADEAILSVFEDTASSIERRKGKTTGCPVTNLAVELALADRDLRALLDGVFSDWEDAIRTRLRWRSDAAAISTTIVASFAGAMTLAKTAQSARPLRLCATSIQRLLKGA